MENKKDSLSFFKIVKIILSITFKECPVIFLLNIIFGILHGVSFGIRTVFLQKFIDSISKVIIMESPLKSAIVKLVLLCVVLIINQILNGVANFITGELFYYKEIGLIGKKLNEKSCRISAINFENPRILDDINKAQKGLEVGIDLVIAINSFICFYIPYFSFMAIYLYKLKPILAVSIVLIFIPVELSQVIRTNLFSKLEDKIAPRRRAYEYYEKCIIDREFFKDTRSLGAFSFFRHLYKEALNLMNIDIWNIEKKSAIIEGFMSFLTLLGYIGVVVLLIYFLLNKSISIGAFSAVLFSIGLMFDMMQQIVCKHIGKIAENIGTVGNFVRFLYMEEKQGEKIEIVHNPSITIKNVSFKYPGAKDYSLININFTIKPMETVAIVGENGAGKSTLVKMILGIYSPSDGKVLINGKSTSNLSCESLYKNISVVFQKFQKYKLTLAENIAISEKKDYDKDVLNNAVLKSDLNINKEKFKDGYNTILSREFDGIDLSGGQWQRVAIARGLYKSHSMIVLDEPTSAIDPIEETKLYIKFSELSKGKTSIIVTHRLGSAKIADRIVVMDKGKVVQIGTHDELINISGKYAIMYAAQSKWYDQ
ncbi:ABC transporter ATP-binding protein [Clostridium akagii]|uniref:ABC transporter ATP-binding protein n=1 Tax=Clostridium akagii TaxID=91623 RepID=UPI0005683514|nr:ABC transporter ATP-binding protein [Clostridium akagii]